MRFLMVYKKRSLRLTTPLFNHAIDMQMIFNGYLKVFVMIRKLYVMTVY